MGMMYFSMERKQQSAKNLERYFNAALVHSANPQEVDTTIISYSGGVFHQHPWISWHIAALRWAENGWEMLGDVGVPAVQFWATRTLWPQSLKLCRSDWSEFIGRSEGWQGIWCRLAVLFGMCCFIVPLFAITFWELIVLIEYLFCKTLQSAGPLSSIAYFFSFAKTI